MAAATMLLHPLVRGYGCVPQGWSFGVGPVLKNPGPLTGLQYQYRQHVSCAGMLQETGPDHTLLAGQVFIVFSGTNIGVQYLCVSMRILFGCDTGPSRSDTLSLLWHTLLSTRWQSKHACRC